METHHGKTQHGVFYRYSILKPHVHIHKPMAMCTEKLIGAKFRHSYSGLPSGYFDNHFWANVVIFNDGGYQVVIVVIF